VQRQARSMAQATRRSQQPAKKEIPSDVLGVGPRSDNKQTPSCCACHVAPWPCAAPRMPPAAPQRARAWRRAPTSPAPCACSGAARRRPAPSAGRPTSGAAAAASAAAAPAAPHRPAPPAQGGAGQTLCTTVLMHSATAVSACYGFITPQARRGRSHSDERTATTAGKTSGLLELQPMSNTHVCICNTTAAHECVVALHARIIPSPELFK